MYSAQINRKNPMAFLFLVDQSGSMDELSSAKDESGNFVSRAVAVADAINIILEELVSSATHDEGIRDYFEVALIGYGGDEIFLWEGNLQGRSFAKISEIKDNAKPQIYEVENIIRGKLTKEEHIKLSWLTPKAMNQTPMRGAFKIAEEELKKWVENHKNSFPPIVINITDGEANDVTDEREMISASEDIKNIYTNDGKIILINIHISNGGQSVVFPSDISEIPNNSYAQMLFKMSSSLPNNWKQNIQELFQKDRGLLFNNDVIGMGLNVKMVELIRMLDIGTRGATRDIGFMIR
jgi:hypothetical protein